MSLINELSWLEVLIDTGHQGGFKDVLQKLKDDSRNIDYVFLTHSYGDHIGGIGSIIKNTDFKVRGIFYWAPVDNKISISNVAKVKKLRDISTNPVRMIHCEQLDGEVISRIRGLFEGYLDVLYPITGYSNEYSTADLNSNSIVIDVKVEGYHMLFMGDATVEKEQMILEDCHKKGVDLSKTVFWKIGHHASKTASSDTFVTTILGNDFKKAICSCKETWSSTCANREPSSPDKVYEIESMLLAAHKDKIEFTGKDFTRRDIKMIFTFTGGSVVNVSC